MQQDHTGRQPKPKAFNRRVGGKEKVFLVKQILPFS
jgi:hypothetical protein